MPKCCCSVWGWVSINRAWSLESQCFCMECSSRLQLWQPSCSRWYCWHEAMAGVGKKRKKKKGSFWGQNRFGWASRDLVLLRGEKYFLRARRTSLGACSLAETAPDVMNRIHRERANSFWHQRKPTSKRQIFGAQALWECTLQLGSRSPFSSSPVSLVFQQRQVLFPEEDQVLLQWETRQ